jgi:hypothetical protein
LLLPGYTSAGVTAIPSPVEGSIVFVTDLKQIFYFDGTQWIPVYAEYLEPPVYSGLPELSGVSLAGGSTVSAMMSMGMGSGVLVLPSFAPDSLVNIDFPKEGLLLYDAENHRPVYYDGIDWISPPLSSPALAASNLIPSQSLPGIRIGEGTKDPNALLHIFDSQRGLGVPIAGMKDIAGPHAGLIIFDPELQAVCLFDGAGWQVVK